MLISASLTKWIVVYPKKVKNSLDDFIALIIRTSLPMNFKVSPPMQYVFHFICMSLLYCTSKVSRYFKKD